jgi:hypothetical protein
MSKRGYISRYLLIVKKLQRKPYSTYEEVQSYIENQFEYLKMQDENLQIGFSKRTLQRDIKEIRNFRRFYLRSKEKVSHEWSLICTAYNLRKLRLCRA